tara:strand:- start:265 stop:432 length:168 start_codon:yes stop_codon:yes gene_type:complete
VLDSLLYFLKYGFLMHHRAVGKLGSLLREQGYSTATEVQGLSIQELSLIVGEKTG